MCDEATVVRRPLNCCVEIDDDEKRKGRGTSCCCEVMPAKNGMAEEDETAMSGVVEVVGVVMVEDAGLFRLRSPTLFLPSDSDRSLSSRRNCGCEKAS
jgi:hypothetical protein